MSKLKNFKQLVFNRSWSELFSRAFELTFGYILYAISFLIPRNHKRWVFGTNVGFADNAKYLYIATEKYNDIDSCWISETKQEAKELQKRGIKVHYKYSLIGLYYCLTAKFYIFTYHSRDINFFTSGGAKKINLWHGVGIKKGSKSISKSMPSWLSRILLPHMYEHFDLFLSTSPLMTEHFKEMFSMPQDVIYEGMYPRCSFLMMPEDKINQIITATEPLETINLIYKIKTFNKAYVYMPTWRINLKDDFISAAGIDFEQIDRIMKKQNSIFLFKLHPAVKIVHQQHTYTNILFIDKAMDMYSILPYTDMLITDYSSIYYDYLLMPNKQILLYPFDIIDYKKHSDELAFDYEKYTPGKRVYRFDELCSIISDTAADCNISQRQWVLQQFWGDYKNNGVTQLIHKIQSL